MNSPLAALTATLDDVMIRDKTVLKHRLQGAVKRPLTGERQRQWEQQMETAIATSHQRVQDRRAAVPAITYPENLPVSQKRPAILEAIRDHQVVIVAGETGSGKTTQLPKICLELGRGVTGMIGHTQPRRLAARSVADRISSELATPLGGPVGYKVRFNDQSGENTLVKLMTDGILLAEIQQDRQLLQYDTLIIDEAHERSLNIDFILGYLHQLLPRRPDLKVIITSATIDPERFSRHFHHAPIIEVSGRTYPVEVRYRPLVEQADDEGDQAQGIYDAVHELSGEGPRDILIFMSGEREIRDTADGLNRLNLPDTEVLPLYARLSNSEQNRVFQSHTGRRIVLATNVAETSLTVPGIKYVIDPGTARISRYSFRTKAQRLPIEPISQASANQRKGRCGRVSEGICIRLYSEQDFLSRPAFTDPEILRHHLASVILQMTALELGDIAAFPFVEAPDKRHIQDGMRLLEELGALEGETARGYRLSPLGRQLAQLPLDPRLARMVLAAREGGCVREVIIIAAALSIQDPRERPMDKKQALDVQHRRFADTESDFLAFVNLWDYLQTQQKNLSSSQFRRQCRGDFLSYLRVQEWQDIYTQLRQTVKTLGLPINAKPADYRSLHCALLTGLLSHIGQKDTDKQEYTGTRNARFALYPGSELFTKPPKWTMVAELVETSRLWGRTAARIEPEWIEPLASHLVKRSYSEPHWEKAAGAVMAAERVTLLGLPIVIRRKVNYGAIDPLLCRELFIRHALVEGDWQTRHPFFRANRRLLDEVEELEHKSRRRDILVDDETLFAFYDSRIGQEVVSTRHFNSWWQQVQKTDPERLNFAKTMLMRAGAETISAVDYPNLWRQGNLKLRLSYQFKPGSDADGVTVHIPLPLLNQVSPQGFDWQIPGIRRELVIALIKSLPKPLRRNFVPAPTYAEAFLSCVTPDETPLLDALERELRRMSGVTLERDAWQLDHVPDHLKITFRVVDEQQKSLAEGKDLDMLKARLKDSVHQTLAAVADKRLEQENLQSWNFGTLPQRFEQKKGGYQLMAWPALVDELQSVAIRLFETEKEQQRTMWQGVRRLLLLNIPSPIKSLHEQLPNKAKLGLYFNPYGKVLELIDDCMHCGVDKLMADQGGPVWQEQDFQRLQEYVRGHLNTVVVEIVSEVEQILSVMFAIHKRLKGKGYLSQALALSDIKTQLDGLVYRGFVTASGWRRLGDILRYLRAVERRLDKLAIDPHRDRVQMLKVEALQQAWRQWRAKLTPARRDEDDVAEIRWMIEELRVSFFAQQLGTPAPVSEKRIQQAMDLIQP
ncbi:ATP-dependent RNA helicase HrpA [Sodalis-like symbiont of Philaenus spumarius]|nr:ATP-dependent RNA helicase HrpA [Sodalis-like symbiont of Philaenus spumarius]OZI14254.1 ATP-dependent RNA helicase HrpA [Sodalis-like symbiont of Philaenus spumarius]